MNISHRLIPKQGQAWGIGSTYPYYRKKEKEKQELFCKVEPSLTLRDFPTLERKGADSKQDRHTCSENTICQEIIRK
jgi:hypothetical protein